MGTTRFPMGTVPGYQGLCIRPDLKIRPSGSQSPPIRADPVPAREPSPVRVPGRIPPGIRSAHTGGLSWYHRYHPDPPWVGPMVPRWYLWAHCGWYPTGDPGTYVPSTTPTPYRSATHITVGRRSLD